MGFFGGQTKQEAMSGPGFEEETFEDAFDSPPPCPSLRTTPLSPRVSPLQVWSRARASFRLRAAWRAKSS